MSVLGEGPKWTAVEKMRTSTSYMNNIKKIVPFKNLKEKLGQKHNTYQIL